MLKLVRSVLSVNFLLPGVDAINVKDHFLAVKYIPGTTMRGVGVMGNNCNIVMAVITYNYIAGLIYILNVLKK